MADGTSIEWCDASWNPVAGCDRVSPGCLNCYAVRMARRLATMPQAQAKYRGLTVVHGNGKPDWSGVVRCQEDELRTPLTWRKPRRIFVDSMSDTFHKDVPFEFLDKLFAVMALCPQHTFLLLTKRPERAEEYFSTWATRHKWGAAARAFLDEPNVVGGRDVGCVERVCNGPYPLPNVWLGTSTEDQRTADERIPHLLRCHAAVYFLSMEPLLGPITLRSTPRGWNTTGKARIATTVRTWLEYNQRVRDGNYSRVTYNRINWVIVGGESGPGARPVHPDWVRTLRDECQHAKVPFFFKQWGEFFPHDQPEYHGFATTTRVVKLDEDKLASRVGKKTAGRSLDGREWNEYPTIGGHA